MLSQSLLYNCIVCVLPKVSPTHIQLHRNIMSLRGTAQRSPRALTPAPQDATPTRIVQANDGAFHLNDNVEIAVRPCAGRVPSPSGSANKPQSCAPIGKRERYKQKIKGMKDTVLSIPHTNNAPELKVHINKLRDAMRALIDENVDLEMENAELKGAAPRTLPSLNKMRLTVQIVSAKGLVRDDDISGRYMRADMGPNHEYDLFAVIDATDEQLTQFLSTDLPVSVTLETTRTGYDDWIFHPSRSLGFNPIDSPNGIERVTMTYNHPDSDYKYNTSIQLKFKFDRSGYEELTNPSNQLHVDVFGQMGRRIYAKLGRIVARHGGMSRQKSQLTGQIMLRTHCTHGLFSNDPYDAIFTPFEVDGSNVLEQRPFYVATAASTVVEQATTQTTRLNGGRPVIYRSDVYDGDSESQRRAQELQTSLEQLTQMLGLLGSTGDSSAASDNRYLQNSGASSSSGCL